ncbi:solute carrier organic anion transporter family member 74D-like [Homalodisca vitripennis]|uniref:solute carrier organic anion transporter family member 74D-like n=1 Tax=Homalodisca vitripennis TaxID=197043 RepID=UPI001EEB8D49|nr:solute carrier organic anion transporter family member 74D-like [Homalodisca vitripennis]
MANNPETTVKIPEEEKLMTEHSEEPPRVLSGHQTSEDEKGEPEEAGMKMRRLTDIALQLQNSPGETSCGLGCVQGKLLQKFANKKAFVIMYGVLGIVTGSTNAYFNGTITTLEKRFKIPSTNTGIIIVGGEISQLFLGLLLNYYGGKGHRPRWIAFGVYTVVAYCLMNALCHLLYGPGQDALFLTEEFGGHLDLNTTARLIDAQNRKGLCQKDGVVSEDCSMDSGSLAPQVILFLAHVMSGIGGSLYYTLGVCYMDDNIQKSKSPALVGLSFFMRMLGPAFGYTMASLCLSIFISPSLTPTITKQDPRWLGAWWIGWLVIAVFQAAFGALIGLFPKTLPRAAARQILANERRKAAEVKTGLTEEMVNEMPASLRDMATTCKKLMRNKILMYNIFASVFYIAGFLPFWTFMPKYIETIYRQSAAFASFITGTVGLIFSGIGILGSSLLISKIKPRARSLAAWNVAVGIFGTLGFISYVFLGCPLNERLSVSLATGVSEATICNQDCQCSFVKYSPVCSPEGRTFVSACHAGCSDYRTLANGSKVYTDCSCVPKTQPAATNLSLESVLHTTAPEDSWFLTEGACRVDCGSRFYIYLAIVCFVKFIGASGRTSNFLVSLRCVDQKDKTVSMALNVLLMTLFAFIPAPILFGHFIDSTCLIWGKTCTRRGNCWLYDADKLKYLTNLTSAAFIGIGTLFDVGVWYSVKDMKVFDEEVEGEGASDNDKTQERKT